MSSAAKRRWKGAGLIVKAANRFGRSRKSVIYIQLHPDRSDSDDEDEPQPNTEENRARRKAEVAVQKLRAQAEYDEHISWATAGGGNGRRLSVMMAAHGANAAEEELETYTRALITKAVAIKIAKAAAKYAWETFSKADQTVQRLKCTLDAAEAAAARKIAQKAADAAALASAVSAAGKAATVAALAAVASVAMLSPLAPLLAQVKATKKAASTAAYIALQAAGAADGAFNAMFTTGNSVGMRQILAGVIADAAAVALAAAYTSHVGVLEAKTAIERWKSFGPELRKMQSLMSNLHGLSSDEDSGDEGHA
jgi:hypothetical protein